MEFNYYDILTSERDSKTGTITTQLGDAIAGQKIVDDAEYWQQVGFASRPSNVQENAKDSAQALSIGRTDGDIVFATRDIRGQEIYGNLNPGDTCLYASGPDTGGQARIYLKGDDSSINIFSRKDKDADGMGIFIDPGEDTIRITNAAGNGILIGPDDVKIFKSGSSAVAVGDKLKLGSSSTVSIDGGSIAIGDRAQQVNINATSQITLGGQSAILPVIHTVAGGSGSPATGVGSVKVLVAP